ncbi:MAG: glutamine synthetase family protein [Bacteroidales bacterium]|nr:glutamine synthetase family protein [Bacteroidales bacterium]
MADVFNPNQLVQYLDKPASDFTRDDLIRFIEGNEIQLVNFRYAGGDNRLKTLNFVINSRKHLEKFLTTGERVDGSSLFKNIGAGASDLYVIPRYRTAFVNPFSDIPTLEVLCSYYDRNGQPLATAPDNILRKANATLKERTGFEFYGMGELEYYIISELDNNFKAADQRGYHEATPFSKWSEFLHEAMVAIAGTGALIKYGHSEVGNFIVGDKMYEQNEIEFIPAPVEDAADHLVIAKWILRTMAWKYGVELTFAPKITEGKAGSGMHIHTMLKKGDRNAYVDKGNLSDVAKRAIAGFLDLAPSLTAFGNTNPTSYFRLVPHQEAPTNVCWGDSNRSALVRVPLGWRGKTNMSKDANPLERNDKFDFSDMQTVEFRASDGSANVYLLMAGLVVAARHGLEMKDALKFAERTYVTGNIFDKEHEKQLATLAQLPTCCWDSADALIKQQQIYEQYGVFTPEMIQGLTTALKAHDDKNIRKEIEKHPEKLMQMVETFFHCG